MKTNAERCKEWRAKNRERVRESQREWRANNPEKVNAYSERYRLSEKGQAAMQRMHNKQTAERIRMRALAAATGGGAVVNRLNNEILNLYKRGKTPADIVIRLHIPMSRVMAVIQNA